MDIFSIANKQAPISDFDRIIQEARKGYWLDTYPPTIVFLKGLDKFFAAPARIDLEKVPFLTFPWPSWNERWSLECINLSNFIVTQFPHLSYCHYSDLLHQVKYDFGCQTHVLFFNKKDLGL